MKAISAAALVNKKFKLLNWQGSFLEAFGNTENTGVWFVWGGSGNGKTTFVFQMVKALITKDKAMVNSLEEGNKLTMKNTLIKVGLSKKELRRITITCEPMDEFSKRLIAAQPMPKIAVVDSVQMTNWTWADYVAFKQAHADKLLVFISQSEKGKPIGKLAERIKFDANQKIMVEGFRAISNGRSNPGGIYTIWAQGAANYWGIKETEQNNNNKEVTNEN